MGNLGIIVFLYNSIPFTKINKSIKIKHTKIVIITQDHRNTKIEQIKTIFNVKRDFTKYEKRVGRPIILAFGIYIEEYKAFLF